MPILASLAAGLLFGLGLAVSGLINPAKVQAFLDVAGAWDPSLIATMGAAVLVTAIGYRFVFARGRPLFDSSFSVPTRRDVDARLVGGAILFGAGWGLSGFCPGPAVAALSQGRPEFIAFVATMLAGMFAGRVLTSGRVVRPAVSR